MIFDPVRINQAGRPSDVVPRDHDDNVRFRMEMFSWLEDEAEQAENRLLEWCRIDPLFWMDALVWTKDPRRHPGDSMRPWISLSFQREEVIPALEKAMGDAYTAPGEEGQIGHDLCCLKTRDVGMSVAIVSLAGRRFYCFSDTIGRFVSINEDTVDVRNDPDTLFGKLDLLTDRLPSFFRDGVRRVEGIFERPADNCIIRGSGTTTQTGRGGRPHWLIADEFSAWLAEKSNGFSQSSAGSTSCRIFIGTAQGMGNGFHRVATDPNVPKLLIPWTKHPWHTQGLYRAENGDVALLDVEFWKTTAFRWLKKKFPLLAVKMEGVADGTLLREVYPFVKTGEPPEGVWDGVTRSVYFDNESLRYQHKWMRASELNCDFIGSNTPFFDTGLLQGYVRDMGRAPFRTGELFQDQLNFDPLSFQETPTGRFKLWFHPPTVAGNLRPSPGHPYCMGVDISAGVGATPSVIAVWRCDTSEKIFKFLRRDVRPAGWAQWAYTVQRWFGGKCPIMFEGGGVGNDFGARLNELGATGVYWMKDGDGDRKKLPGYHFNQAMKRSMLDSYGQALCTRRAINRDIDAVSEGFQFQMTAGIGVQHAAVANAASAADSEANHGDEFTADALAWFWMTENGYGAVERPKAAIDPEEERAYKYDIEERERRYSLVHW